MKLTRLKIRKMILSEIKSLMQEETPAGAERTISMSDSQLQSLIKNQKAAAKQMDKAIATMKAGKPPRVWKKLMPSVSDIHLVHFIDSNGNNIVEQNDDLDRVGDAIVQRIYRYIDQNNLKDDPDYDGIISLSWDWDQDTKGGKGSYQLQGVTPYGRKAKKGDLSEWEKSMSYAVMRTINSPNMQRRLRSKDVNDVTAAFDKGYYRRLMKLKR